jgi:hypothetical protein
VDLRCRAGWLGARGLFADTAAPVSSASLPAQADQATRLEHLGAIDGGSSLGASLLTYQHVGLRLNALVAAPLTPPPPQGWPVLVANHGSHPDPPRLGTTPGGRDWRPVAAIALCQRPVPQRALWW